MATCRQVIYSALRKIGAGVDEGNPAAKPYPAQIGLELLQSLYRESVASGLFGRLTDVTVSADYEAKENERIHNSSDDDIEITLPATIVDAVTGETRVPINRAVVQVSGDTPVTYIYSHLINDWIAIDDLTLNSEAPLSEQGVNGLACWLAVLLADDGFGATPSAETIRVAARFRGAQALRYDAARVPAEVEFF